MYVSLVAVVGNGESVYVSQGRVGFAKAYHKIPHRTKRGRCLGLGSSQKFGVLL